VIKNLGNGIGGGGSITPTAGPATTTLNNGDTFGIFQGGTWQSVTAQIVASYVASAIAGTYLAANVASGSTNDFNPATFGPTVNRLDLDPNAGNSTLTGLLAGIDNQLILVANVNATNSLTLSNQDAGSAAANRFRASDSFTLLPGGSIWLSYYAGTVNRWVIAP
jgi:hypothetical protein